MSDRPARPWDLFNKNIGRVETVIAQERLEACSKCEHYVKVTSQCTQCGCFMKAKARLPNASCPIGKWDAVRVSISEEQ